MLPAELLISFASLIERTIRRCCCCSFVLFFHNYSSVKYTYLKDGGYCCWPSARLISRRTVVLPVTRQFACAWLCARVLGPIRIHAAHKWGHLFVVHSRSTTVGRPIRSIKKQFASFHHSQTNVFKSKLSLRYNWQFLTYNWPIDELQTITSSTDNSARPCVRTPPSTAVECGCRATWLTE